MGNDRVDVFVRRMAELAFQLSELEILKDKVAEAQQRALAVTIEQRSPVAKIRTKAHPLGRP